jgi:hypothetical protein
MVMDVAAADETKLMEEEKDGPSGTMLRSILLRYSMSGTCGPRDMIS